MEFSRFTAPWGDLFIFYYARWVSHIGTPLVSHKTPHGVKWCATSSHGKVINIQYRNRGIPWFLAVSHGIRIIAHFCKGMQDEIKVGLRYAQNVRFGISLGFFFSRPSLIPTFSSLFLNPYGAYTTHSTHTVSISFLSVLYHSSPFPMS